MKKVLLVEDNPISAKLTQKMFEDQLEFCHYYNALEALEILEDSIKRGDQFQAIFLDLDLPDSKGLLFLKMIRMLEEFGNIQRHLVLVITADPKMVPEHSSYYELCDEVISKPVHKESLYEALVKTKLIEEVPNT